MELRSQTILRRYVLPFLACACVGLLCWRVTERGNAQSSEAVVLIPPPSHELGLQPEQRSGALYGHAAGLEQWHVAQWNNPGPELPDFANGRTGNGSITVQIDGTNAPAFTIFHDGADLHCMGPSGEPLESDAFIGANRSAASRIPLAQLRDISHSIHLRNQGERSVQGPSLQCPVSKAVGLTAIVLDNPTHGSTLFYQILLFGLEMVPHSFWYRRGSGGIFGFNDTSLAYDQPLANSGRSVQYRFNLLPRIAHLIADPSLQIDRNLSDWVIGGAYFGTSIWGHVNTQTQWSGFTLTGISR